MARLGSLASYVECQLDVNHKERRDRERDETKGNQGESKGIRRDVEGLLRRGAAQPHPFTFREEKLLWEGD